MIRTRVGYAGGTKKNPTYRSLGDHSETIQIDYDPSRISYSELLEIFWDSHNPTSQSWSRQYRNILFFHNKEQERLSEESRDRLASEKSRKIVTDLVQYRGFYIAEDYHQKHSLQNIRALMDEYRTFYPKMKDLIDSTAASRVNGFLAGYGECESLERELDNLGLSDAGKNMLTEIVCGRKSSTSCGIGK